MDIKGIFSKDKKTEKKKPTKELTALEAGIKLDQLKERCEDNLRVLRRRLQGNPTKKQREMAEAEIRTTICTYTVICQAIAELDQIRSTTDLNRTLRELNGTLKTIRKLRGGGLGASKGQLNREIGKMQKRQEGREVTEVFTDESQATIDDWLGFQFGDVAQKYIDGAKLSVCLRDSQEILDNNPIPHIDELFQSGDSDSGIGNWDDLFE